MRFNQLYNLILQSIIITQGREFRENLLRKKHFNDWGIKLVLDYLSKFDNKTGDFLCKFIVTNQLEGFNDRRVPKIIKILKLNPSFDTQNYKGTLKQFLAKYENLLVKDQQKQQAKNIKELDKIKQFSQKKTYDKGVVVYKVQDSQEGMMAVRKIVDLQWGEDCNPWCIIARNKTWDGKNQFDRAWMNWKQHSAYPKRIAFQNGKLIAFCASNGQKIQWWDRNDKPHNELILPNGEEVKTNITFWGSDEDIKKRFVTYHDLRLNTKTGRWENIQFQNQFEIKDNQLLNGHVPVPLGKIMGHFYCTQLKNLTSLQNMPLEVTGGFSIEGCQNLQSLKGCPQTIGGKFTCNGCDKIKTLEGCPQTMYGLMVCGCDNIKNLEGLPDKIYGAVMVGQCPNLMNFQGAPSLINGDLRIIHCDNLIFLGTSLKTVNGDLWIACLPRLKTLDGAPSYIKKGVRIQNCKELKKLGKGLDFIGYKKINQSYCYNLHFTEEEFKKYILSDDYGE